MTNDWAEFIERLSTDPNQGMRGLLPLAFKASRDERMSKLHPYTSHSWMSLGDRVEWPFVSLVPHAMELGGHFVIHDPTVNWLLGPRVTVTADAVMAEWGRAIDEWLRSKLNVSNLIEPLL